MKKNKSNSWKVIVLATSKQTKGGITSVVNAHSKCDFWINYHVKWIETHIDNGVINKWWYAIKSFTHFLFILPRYDLVHIHISEYPSLLRKMPFFIISKLFKKKTIIHFHSFSPDTTVNSKYKNLYYYIFNNSDKVIVLSELWKNWLKKYLLLEKNIHVIYNPCMPPTIDPTSYSKKSVILYAGAVCQRKGYEDLIKGFALIADKYPEWKVIFAGNGEIQKGTELALTLQIGSQIEFAGWVSGEAKEKLFASANIFCLPSYAEGFPVAMLDASAFGLPIITTPVGGIPDIITDNRNGLLFKPGDIQKLSILLDMLISDTELRNKLSNESQALANNIFDLKTIGKQIEALYESILNK